MTPPTAGPTASPAAILYDDRLRGGMRESEAMPIVHRIIAAGEATPGDALVRATPS